MDENGQLRYPSNPSDAPHWLRSHAGSATHSQAQLFPAFNADNSKSGAFEKNESSSSGGGESQLSSRPGLQHQALSSNPFDVPAGYRTTLRGGHANAIDRRQRQEAASDPSASQETYTKHPRRSKRGSPRGLVSFRLGTLRDLYGS